MKFKLSRVFRAYATAAFAAVVFWILAAQAQTGTAFQNGASEPAIGEDFILFNFEQVDVRVFTQLVGEFTGKRFVVADDVVGKITVVSPKVSRESAFLLFVAVLESSGFTVVTEDEINRVVKLPDRAMGMGTVVGDGDESPQFGLITRIMQLNHVTASEMRKMLESHLQRKDSVSALDETNHLIITDTADAIARVEELVRQLDKPGMARVMEVLPLQHADAVSLAQQLSAAYSDNPSRAYQLLDRIPPAPGESAAASAMRPPTIVPAEHANRLIVTGTPRQIEQVKLLVAEMDVPAPTGRNALNAILLSYIKAEDVAKNVTALLEKSAAQNVGAGARRKVSVEAVPSNNALLVDAAPEDFLEVRRLVESLDVMPQQVHISVLIAEVSDGDAETLGVEMTALNAPDSKGDTQFAGGTRPNVSGGVVSMADMAAGMFGRGLTFGIAHGSHLDADGNLVADYPAIFNLDLIRQNNRVKILSDTSLGAQNNHPAEVAIVDNIGILESTVQGSGADRDFIQNITRMDVGVKVNMTPHIIPGGLVRVELEPSIEAVTDSGTTSGTAYVPTISKRMVKTTMTVADGQTIVIAGLTRNDDTEVTKKIPILGDIPLLGWLFRWDSKSVTKSNILIFVTPRIMSGPEDADAVRSALEASAGLSADVLRASMSTGATDAVEAAADSH